MEKLNNWNPWCNDKVVLHSADNNLPVLLSPNAVLALEEGPDYTTVALVDGLFFDVKEKAEEILGFIAEMVEESEKRRQAREEEQRKQYAEMMKEQTQAKPSEG